MYKNDRIGQRDEIYPGGVGAGYPGYTRDEAVKMKAKQEEIMRQSSNTIDIIVEIEAISNRSNEYIVHNKSTYARYA